MSALFFILAFVFALAGLVPFYGQGNLRFKQRYFRWYVVLGGALIFGGIASSSPMFIVVLAGVGVIIMTVLNIENVSFCRKCEATVVGQVFLARDQCPKCGAGLPVDRGK